MRTRHRQTIVATAILLPALLSSVGGPSGGGVAWADEPPAASTPAVGAQQAGGQPVLLDAAGNPVFVVNDGHADKHTFNGFRQYTGNCARCHGPDGVGSSFGPALAIALSRMDYSTFHRIVTNGRRNPNLEDSVMPAFADNPNVSGCVDDIYRYLRARASGALGRGRPQRLPD